VSTKRNVLLLVLLLLLQLVTLAVQTEASGGHGSLAEEVFLRGVAPFSRTVTAVRHGFIAARDELRLWGHLRRENSSLRAEVRDLRVRLMRLYGVEGELSRLENATAYRASHSEPFLIANVVYSDTDSWLRNLIVRLPNGKAKVDDAAVTPSGVVGRVIVVAGDYAKVQLITDRSASVGAMIERNRRQGLVESGPDGELLLELVPLHEDVRTGDRVVTSGTDGIFPRGLLLGTVESVTPGGGLFYRIELQPAVEARQVDQLYLVPAESPPDALRESTNDARR
jgi:rod shape-determining protein MreC